MTASMHPNQPVRYVIEVEGVIDARWSEWFGDLDLTLLPARGDRRRTTLIACLPDQSALPSVLARVTGLNLKILSVMSETQPGSK